MRGSQNFPESLITLWLHIHGRYLLYKAAGQANSQVDASQRKFANQNLHTALRRVAKRIRKSARKFTQVIKSRKFYVYTVDL